MLAFKTPSVAVVRAAFANKQSFVVHVYPNGTQIVISPNPFKNGGGAHVVTTDGKKYGVAGERSLTTNNINAMVNVADRYVQQHNL